MLVYPCRSGCAQGREHDMVCIFLGVLRGIFEGAFWVGLEPCSRAVIIAACRKYEGSAPIACTRAKSRERDHCIAPRHLIPELIQHVRGGHWDPDENMDDRKRQNALIARGYWQAYQAVRHSMRKVLEGENPGAVCHDDHGNWYREMFGPLVTAGFLRPADLAGYRNGPVYIRRSMHVPPRHEAVRSCMPAFFDLLKEEPEPSVRVVLGHFIPFLIQ